VLFSFVMGIAGIDQLLLSSYIISKFGNGPLPAPIGVAMFMIHFPEIAVFVGLVYILNAGYGMYRGLTKADDHIFSFTMWLQYLCTLLLMVLVQTSFAPGNAMAPAAPTIANLTLGTHIMPVFLDYMGRSTPDQIDPDYYEIGTADSDDVQEQAKAEKEDV
jgi:hypothetical protein